MVFNQFWRELFAKAVVKNAVRLKYLTVNPAFVYGGVMVPKTVWKRKIQNSFVSLSAIPIAM